MNSHTFLIVTALLIGSSMQKSVSTKKAEAFSEFPLSFDKIFSTLKEAGFDIRDETQVENIFGEYDKNKNKVLEEDEWRTVNKADVQKALTKREDKKKRHHNCRDFYNYTYC